MFFIEYDGYKLPVIYIDPEPLPFEGARFFIPNVDSEGNIKEGFRWVYADDCKWVKGGIDEEMETPVVRGV